MNIYPPELTLKRTTESDTTFSYLDVSISICQGKFITEVFDKRDNFNFNIVNYPYMCSNIPTCTKPTYGVYTCFWYSKLYVVHLESLQGGI